MLSNVVCLSVTYMQQYWLSVIVQLLNAPLYFYIFSIKDDLKFLRWSLISCLLFGIGYFGVSAWSGVIFSLFSIAYLIVSYVYKKNIVKSRLKYITFIIILILTVSLNLYFERKSFFVLYNFFPIMGMIPSIIHAYVYICSSVNSKVSRWLFIISHTLLIIYEIIIVLPLFAMVDVCGLLSNIRELKKTNKCQKPNF